MKQKVLAIAQFYLEAHASHSDSLTLEVTHI